MGAQPLPEPTFADLVHQLHKLPALVHMVSELEAKVIELNAEAVPDPGYKIAAAADYLGLDAKTVKKYMALDLLHPLRLHYTEGESAWGHRIPLSELKNWQKRFSTRRHTQPTDKPEAPAQKQKFKRKKPQ